MYIGEKEYCCGTISSSNFEWTFFEPYGKVLCSLNDVYIDQLGNVLNRWYHYLSVFPYVSLKKN